MEGKGIIQQIREAPVDDYSKFNLSTLKKVFKDLEEGDRIRREKHNRILEENRNHLVNRSVELGEDIPISLWGFMYYHPYYIGGDTAKKYSKWLRDETMKEKVERLGKEEFNEWLEEEFIRLKKLKK